MDIAKVIPKAQKRPKANDFKSILEQFLEKYDLSAESSLKQLSEHASGLDVPLQDLNARKCIKRPPNQTQI
jgi:hypothetical protein